MALITWQTADDWDRFASENVNTITGGQTLTLGATGGEGTVDGGLVGDGNDRRVLRIRGQKVSDVDARLDFRLVPGGQPTPQVGLTFHRKTGPPLTVWTNVIFEANAQMLLGAWAYDGVTLTTNQDAFTHTLRDNGIQQLAGDPTRVRSIQVRIEGRNLKLRQWMRDQPRPAWQYDADMPATVTGVGPGDVGLIIAHTGNNRGNIFLDTLSVASMDDYVSLRDMKRWLRFDPEDLDTPHPDDALFQAAISATSRWVERKALRHFYQIHESRVFEADDYYNLALGHFNDLVEITELATDEDGDGVFETVWSPANYQLRPIDASGGLEPRPYRSIRAIGQRFPINSLMGGRLERIRITGTWGWPMIPDAVVTAVKIQAGRIIKRKEAPEGIMGLGQFGVVRVSSKGDPDAMAAIRSVRLRSLG